MRRAGAHEPCGAPAGQLDQFAVAGGGLVEAISEVTAGREAPGRFLVSATVELFEQYGFARIRQVGSTPGSSTAS